jgi:hypothetical protein
MDIDLAALPNDVETLQQLVRSLAAERATLTEAQAEIERLNLIIKKLQRSQFGRRAERLDEDQFQLGFEDLTVDLARTEAKLPSRRRRRPGLLSRLTIGRACRRIWCARTSSSIWGMRPAPAAAVSCTSLAKR